MQTYFWKNLIRFAFLILLQALVLEPMPLPGGLHAIVYPVALLLLPLQAPPMLVVFAGFACGLAVDIACDIPGLNAAAATFLAFCRVVYFKITDYRDVFHDSELTGTPLPSVLGWGGFLRYSVWMLSLFHIAYFLLAACGFENFLYTLWLAAGSFCLCFAAQVLAVSLFARKANTR